MPAKTGKFVYECGDWQIDLARRELRTCGAAIPIGGRAFEIIETFVRSAGELVTKDDLMAHVWPGTIVEENTLQVHISAVRKALGPDRGMLKTVSGRGYRLLGSWTTSQGTTPTGHLNPASTTPAPSFLNNLPAPGSNLIGRAVAVSELQDLLSAYRVITLTGPGGIGKTKLAHEVARNMLAMQVADVWLVELASLSDPDLIPSAIASALGLRFGTADISAEIVARAIGEKKILLVLDNCEHLIDGAARIVETMVRTCPRTTLLTTSREVLRIDGEYVYRVPPLDIPGQREELASVLKHSAVQLFVARTTALQSTFLPNEQNLPQIAAICQRLDGIPLAIEFAAARAATLGVSQVALHLDNRFGLLTGGRRTALGRHQTLRAALDWSYDLLTPSEQCMLRHLSIFPAGFTLDAAAAVMSDTGHEALIIDDVANLVSKSLVTQDRYASAGRWRLLETIREYAIEKLKDNSETEPALRRHAEFFRGLLTPARLASSWEPTPEALIRYGQEIGNVRAALDWCFSPAGDARIGIALTAVSVPIWLHFAFMAECRKRTEHALADLSIGSENDTPLRMLLHIGLGITLNHTGARRDEALAVLTAGLHIAERLEDAVSQMYALWALWVSHGYRGNYRAAEPVAHKFMTLANQNADPARGYLADRLMGTTLHYRGRQPKAREHLDQVSEQYRRSLEQPHTAWFGYNLADFSQSSLARVLCLQGFLDRARDLAQVCIDRTQLANQKLGLCYALAEAACPIALMTNDLDTAQKFVTLLIEAATALDLTYWKTLARCLEGVLLVKQREFGAGLAALQASLNVCEREGGTTCYPTYLGAIAEGLFGLGRIDEAYATLDEALARADRDGEEWCVAALLCTKGEFALGGADDTSIATAEGCFHQALAVARKQGARLWELRSAMSLARLRMAQNRAQDAQDILAPVYKQFEEGFDTADLCAAKAVLDELHRGQDRVASTPRR